MKTKTKVAIIIELSLIVFINLIAISLWADGNHSWAKSEAWTWMGHVNQLEQGTTWTLSDKGFGFIHYFTRNETGQGRMNFKSSAVTTTQNGLGHSYDKRTTFPTESKKDFRLRVRDDKLDIDFVTIDQHDEIREIDLDSSDLPLLFEKILPLYPGLKVSPSFPIKKFIFKAQMGSKYEVDLVFLSIWPDIAPPNQQMEFFGLKESYTFSSPMLVTYGFWAERGRSPVRVVGLSFLDRQWSKEYFGKNVFANPTDLLKKNHALSWAHNWSAFHAYAPTTKDWYFVHLWQQVQRLGNQPDQRAPYTGIQWSKNGQQQLSVDADQFSWTGQKFVVNQSKVLLNYAQGHEALFPFKYLFQDRNGSAQFELEASPKLQSLDQPIYLYEGYARGSGTWDQNEVLIQGRIESSQILFRNVDYENVLESIQTDDPDQAKLASELQLKLRDDKACKNQLENEIEHNKFLFNDLGRKTLIFSAQYFSRPKQSSPNSITYY